MQFKEFKQHGWIYVLQEGGNTYNLLKIKNNDLWSQLRQMNVLSCLEICFIYFALNYVLGEDKLIFYLFFPVCDKKCLLVFHFFLLNKVFLYF